jgi:hypothetical protein
MRVAVNAAHRGSVGVDVVAVRVKAAGAKEARPAKDVERNHHPVAALEILHRRPHLFHHADELVAEGMANSRVRHHPVIQMKV